MGAANCCNSDKPDLDNEKRHFPDQGKFTASDNLGEDNQFPSPDEATLLPENIGMIKEAEQRMTQAIGNYLPDYKNLEGLAFGGPYRYEDDNGTLYLGNYKNGKRHGKGSLLFPHGAIYVGYFQDDLFHDKGAISDPKYWYVGEWNSGVCKGSGVYCMYDDQDASLKTIYEGQFDENARHGTGKETYPDCSCYQGQYVNNFKTGKGRFIWKEGATYEGDFVDNNIHGFGKYVWNDERIYEGEWVENKMEGKGKFYWKDGRIYTGSYMNDKKEGYGEFTWPNGNTYKGHWFDGKQHGEGVIFNAQTNQTSHGVWIKGKRDK